MEFDGFFDVEGAHLKSQGKDQTNGLKVFSQVHRAAISRLIVTKHPYPLLISADLKGILKIWK
jgi:hypothetical protein